MKEKILALLRNNEYTSGEELSKILGISRTAIWKHIQSLKKRGYKIESMPRIGYKLTEVPDLLHPSLVKSGLKTKFIGKKIVHFDELPSTNTKAKELAEAGATEGTVVIAEKQTNGKARLGRTWESPEGGIWMSVILRPGIIPLKAQILTLVAACAVTKSLRELYDLPAFIKWPNDILVKNKKICGILTEIKAELDLIHFLIIGIGVNVNTGRENYTDALKNLLTSVKLFSGKEIDRVELVRSILENLEKEYMNFLQNGSPAVIENWKKYNCTLNKYVKVTGWEDTFTGNAIDITAEGGLVVKCDNGEIRTFYSGEVSLSR